MLFLASAPSVVSRARATAALRFAGTLSVLAIAACEAPLVADDLAPDEPASEPSEVADEAAETTAPSTVLYRLVSDWEGVPLVDGRRRFTTSLGYDVELDAWSLLTSSAELLGCDAPDLGVWMLAHAAYDHDPSVAEVEQRDDVLSGGTWDAGLGAVSEQAYCSALTIYGAGVGQDVATLAGRYREPGAAEWVEFVAHNPVGLSSLAALEAPAIDKSLPSAMASVTQVRYPARALDALDFSALSLLDIAYLATHVLVRDVEVSLDVPPE